MKPTVVCLCGSTRFSEAFQKANLTETLAGRIVLTIGCDMRSDAELFADKNYEELAAIKTDLDELHLRKIDLAHEVLILNVGGYVGQSTLREWRYALREGKRIRFLEPEKALQPGVRVKVVKAPHNGLVMPGKIGTITKVKLERDALDAASYDGIIMVEGLLRHSEVYLPIMEGEILAGKYSHFELVSVD